MNVPSLVLCFVLFSAHVLFVFSAPMTSNAFQDKATSTDLDSNDCYNCLTKSSLSTLSGACDCVTTHSDSCGDAPTRGVCENCASAISAYDNAIEDLITACTSSYNSASICGSSATATACQKAHWAAEQAQSKLWGCLTAYNDQGAANLMYVVEEFLDYTESLEVQPYCDLCPSVSACAASTCAAAADRAEIMIDRYDALLTDTFCTSPDDNATETCSLSTCLASMRVALAYTAVAEDCYYRLYSTLNAPSYSIYHTSNFDWDGSNEYATCELAAEKYCVDDALDACGDYKDCIRPSCTSDTMYYYYADLYCSDCFRTIYSIKPECMDYLENGLCDDFSECIRDLRVCTVSELTYWDKFCLSTEGSIGTASSVEQPDDLTQSLNSYLPYAIDDWVYTEPYESEILDYGVGDFLDWNTLLEDEGCSLNEYDLNIELDYAVYLWYNDSVRECPGSKAVPCGMHGACSSTTTGYYCVCYPGWYGSDCSLSSGADSLSFTMLVEVLAYDFKTKNANEFRVGLAKLFSVAPQDVNITSVVSAHSSRRQLLALDWAEVTVSVYVENANFAYDYYRLLSISDFTASTKVRVNDVSAKIVQVRKVDPNDQDGDGVDDDLDVSAATPLWNAPSTMPFLLASLCILISLFQLHLN
eukprot:TRINITY_DN698_c0_g1::TRINITY_DN698_c0_g1_i1::g.28850::m.28850 TRINITY_DN698_c0_g1::TRINITY_DN698_c0_g1_i1::g.28850  ORF type:complete len:645 (-),score=158.03,EGF/PF00008.22/9.7e+03,EGF/PF00008.22/0.0062,hEGF/PF12661.2/0.56,EGF_2/PF07974.8/8.6e+03,EGF_2/PF07974.8/0.031 TRINITY_DN698_c0_g1_i1:196-2130(-)